MKTRLILFLFYIFPLQLLPKIQLSEQDAAKIREAQCIINNGPEELQMLDEIIQNPDEYHVWNHVLFIGETGLGKTTAMRGMALKSGYEHVDVEGDTLSIGSYTQEEENNLKKRLYELAHSRKRAIITIDEIEYLFSGQCQKYNWFHNALTEIREKNPNVITISCARSYKNLYDTWSKRFDYKVFFRRPEKEERKNVIAFHLAQRNATCDAPLLDKLARETAGGTGRDLTLRLVKPMLRKIARAGRTGYNLQLNDIKYGLKNFKEQRDILKYGSTSYKAKVKYWFKEGKPLFLPIFGLAVICAELFLMGLLYSGK